jgi:hypothetical protein
MVEARVDGKHLRKLQNKLNGLFISPENATEFYDYMRLPRFELTTQKEVDEEIDLLEDVVKTWDGVDPDSAGKFWKRVRELNTIQFLTDAQRRLALSKIVDIHDIAVSEKISTILRKISPKASSKKAKKAKRSKKAKKAKRSKRS